MSIPNIQPETLYTFGESDRLWDSVAEAVERYVEDCAFMADSTADSIEAVEWPLKLHAFRRVTVSPRWVSDRAGGLVETLIADWSDSFGTQVGPNPDPTPEMLAAMESAVRAIVGQLTVSHCEPTGETVTVTKEQAKEMLK